MLNDDYLDSDQMNSLKDWMIPKDHLVLGSGLGQGQFGKVFLGELKMKSGSTKKVACKTMKRKLLWGLILFAFKHCLHNKTEMA
mgnify:FL=1